MGEDEEVGLGPQLGRRRVTRYDVVQKLSRFASGATAALEDLPHLGVGELLLGDGATSPVAAVHHMGGVGAGWNPHDQVAAAESVFRRHDPWVDRQGRADGGAGHLVDTFWKSVELYRMERGRIPRFALIHADVERPSVDGEGGEVASQLFIGLWAAAQLALEVDVVVLAKQSLSPKLIELLFRLREVAIGHGSAESRPGHRGRSRSRRWGGWLD